MGATNIDLPAIQKFVLVLEKSKNTSDRIYDILPVIFCILDSHGRIIKLNSHGCYHFQCLEEDVLGGLFSDFLSPEGKTAFASYFEGKDVEEGQGQGFEVKDRDTDKYVFWQINSFAYERGQEKIHVVIGSDTSALRESHHKVSRLEKQLEVAEAVQAHLMPIERDVSTDFFEFSTCYEAADNVGGDWWWYHAKENGDLIILVGDVSGHGVEAAMTTATTIGARHAIASLASSQGDDSLCLTQIIPKLNQYFTELNKGLQFMSLVGVEISPTKGTATIHFCGAPPVFFFNQDSSSLKLNPGPPLGMRGRKFSPGVVEMPFNVGDRLLVSTDGAYEFVDKTRMRAYGLRRFTNYVSTLSELPVKECRDTVFEKIKSLRCETLMDDITFVLIERTR